jgi:GNAT superfamily N-acetyltransferase
MESRANDGVYQVGHSSLKATVASDTNRGPLSSVRLARIDDLQKLGAVEISAASLFRAVGLGWIADGTPVERAALAAMHKSGTLWVAVDRADEPVGFLAAHTMDGQFHIAEISVARSHQRQGLGRALIIAAVTCARAGVYRYVTLTTYRDLPWNGLFYSKLGFAEIDAGELGPEHALKSQAETKAGHDPSRRCVMAIGL